MEGINLKNPNTPLFHDSHKAYFAEYLISKEQVALVNQIALAYNYFRLFKCVFSLTKEVFVVCLRRGNIPYTIHLNHFIAR
jgi:hypothetical protein